MLLQRCAPLRSTIRRVAGYGLAGLLATSLHYVVMAILIQRGLSPVASTSIGALTGAALHYVLSSRIVFRVPQSARTARSFLAVSILGFAVNAAVVWIVHERAGVSLLWSQLAATGLVFGLTYALNAGITFRQSADLPLAGSKGSKAAPAWASGLLLVCALLMGARLLSLPLYPLTDRTESRYAEIAREMVDRDDWVSPHLHGVPFWGKPPLATWCEAAGIELLGATEFAVRFPAWLAVLLTLGLVWRIGLVLGGPSLARGGFIVCCTAPLTLFMAGGVMTDPFLVLGTVLALLGIVRIASMSVAQWLAHATPVSAVFTVVVGLTLATLAKGPIGLVFGLAPVMGLLLSAEGRRRFRVFPYMNVAIGFILLAVPWFVLAESRTPGFLAYFLVGEHVQRFLDPNWSGDLYGGTHPKPHGIVWLYFGLSLLPWLPAAIRSVSLARWRGIRPPIFGEPLWGVLLVSAATPLLLFTLAGSLLPTYVYPALPAACLLIAQGIQSTAAKSPFVASARSRVPGTVLSVMIPVVVLLAFVPDWVWIRSSQCDVLQDVYATRVIYGRPIETLYSADFYSDGRAVGVESPNDAIWEQVRADPEHSVIVTKRHDQGRIPTDVRARLQLAREMDGYYQMWTLAPR